ncbi:sel1 repeat family protein [Cobetia amphilecti]|nr:sel1 repeat family protein [Cobetia litoralis]
MLKIIILLFVIVITGCQREEVAEVFDISNLSSVEIINNDSGPFSSERLFGEIDYGSLIDNYNKGDHRAAYVYAINLFKGYKFDKNQDKGIEILESLWKQGVVDAGYSLFQIYYLGLGVPENKDVAAKYLKLSADAGYINSQRKLGYIYADRDEVKMFKKNLSQSLYWFKRAAENGDKVAALNVAGMYREGMGIKPNSEKSFEWLEKIPEMPYGDLMTGFPALGNYYEQGIGTDVDLIQAYKYFSLVQPAKAVDRQRVANKMSDKELEIANEMVEKWKERNNIVVPNG